MNTILLIDFSWLYNRYYYVATQRKSNNTYTQNTNTSNTQNTTSDILLEMFISFFKRISFSFSYKVFIVLDPLLKNTINYSLNHEYKGNRDKESKKKVYEDLPKLVSNLKNILKDDFYFVKSPNYEADQVIAYLAEKYKDDNRVIIYSGDKDLIQLTYYDNVYVSNKYEKGFKILTNKDIFEKFKNSKGEDFTRISENKKDILKYRVLKGDTSDNLSPVFNRITDKQIKEIINNYWIGYGEASINEALIALSKNNIELYNKIKDSKNKWILNYKLMNLYNLKIDKIKCLT